MACSSAERPSAAKLHHRVPCRTIQVQVPGVLLSLDPQSISPRCSAETLTPVPCRSQLHVPRIQHASTVDASKPQNCTAAASWMSSQMVISSHMEIHQATCHHANQEASTHTCLTYHIVNASTRSFLFIMLPQNMRTQHAHTVSRPGTPQHTEPCSVQLPCDRIANQAPIQP